jgi:cytochrome bd-type quinol oxidase subunit 1
MAAVLSVIVLGDESGYEMGDVQKTKLAAIEAEWDTQPAPASFTLFGIPNQDKMENSYAIQIPYALGLIATRSTDTQVTGLKDLMAQHEVRIRNGMKAYQLLEELRSGNTDPAVRAEFNKAKQDLGYGCTAETLYPERHRRDGNADPAGDQRLYPTRSTAVLRLPYHGGLWRADVADYRSVVLERASWPHWPEKRGYTVRRCMACRCRGLPSKPAGLWLNTVVNLGRLVRCCRLRLPTLH